MAGKAAVSAHQSEATSGETSAVSEWIGAARRRLPIIGFMAAIIAAQSGISYVLAPKRADGVEKATAAALVDGEDGAALVEVEIDTFHCTNSLADPGVRIGVSFKAVATVSPGQAELLREAVTNSRKYRIRESVIRVVRGCEMAELNEPEQVKLRRHIKNEINRALPADYVYAVKLLDFRQTPQ